MKTAAVAIITKQSTWLVAKQCAVGKFIPVAVKRQGSVYDARMFASSKVKKLRLEQ